MAWAKSFDRKGNLFDIKRIPNTLQVSKGFSKFIPGPYTFIQWIERLNQFLNKLKVAQAPPLNLDGLVAAQKIVSSSHESYSVVGFDAIEATRLGLKEGQTVQVTAEDNGK